MAELMTSAYVQGLYEGEWTTAVAARAEKWLTTALARAKTAAPCLLEHEDLDEHIAEAMRGIIAGAVLRLLQDGRGNTQYQTAGPFATSTDTKLRSDRVLSIADRDELRQLCRAAKKTTARRSIPLRTRLHP